MNTKDIQFSRNKIQTILLAIISSVFYLSQNLVLSTTLFVILTGLLVSAFIDITNQANKRTAQTPKINTAQSVVTVVAQIFIMAVVSFLIWYFLVYKIKVI